MLRICIGCLWFLLSSQVLSGQSLEVLDIVPPNATSFHSQNSSSQVVRDDAGDMVVGWRSSREGLLYSGIYLQKIGPEGNFEWERDGVPVCPNPSNQSNFSMVSDGFGGAVVVWEDSRRGSDEPAVFAQRVNLRGESLWGNYGLLVCDVGGAQRNPQVLADGENGFYVVWEDSRADVNEIDVYGQHLDLGGKRHWRADGLPICTSPNLQQHFSAAIDENNHLFLVWEDFRNGLYWNLFAQKLNRAGEYLWDSGGLDIFPGVEENQHNPAIVSDGSGGLLFIYQKYSDDTHGTDIYRGRLDSRGALLFHFATCYSQDEQLNPQIVRKGSKGILVWEDRRNGNWDIYGQMIRLRDGILEWGINGIPIVKTAADERRPQLIATLSYNNQIFAWERGKPGSSRIYVQKCDNLGGRLWDPDGIPVCDVAVGQAEPAIVADEGGGLWCSWSDRRAGRYTDIYLQKINRNGGSTFSASGLRLAADHEAVFSDVKGLEVLGARDGHFFIAWEDYRNGAGNADIYLQKVDWRGRPQWRAGGIPVCIEVGEQSRPILVDDGVGGVIVAWADQRNLRDDDVYAQRVNGYGKVLWRYNGVKACGARSSQSQIRGVSDGKEGVILAWVDARDLTSNGFDLYIQRLNHSGEVLWKEDGKPFADLPGLQTSPMLESDGLGGAYVSWMDYRGDYSNIYVQHINDFGLYEWEYGGRQLVAMASNQRQPVIAKNFQDDLYLVWQEGRFGDGFEKLFMQRMTQSGRKMWSQRGDLVCNHTGRQSYAQIRSGEDGDFWVAWLDERTDKVTGTRLFAQRFDVEGLPYWSSAGVGLGENMEEYSEFGVEVDSKGNSYFCWTQLESDGGSSVHVQVLDRGGEGMWQYPKKIGGLGAGGQVLTKIGTNKGGKMLIIWVGKTLETGVKGITLGSEEVRK